VLVYGGDVNYVMSEMIESLLIDFLRQVGHL